MKKILIWFKNQLKQTQTLFLLTLFFYSAFLVHLAIKNTLFIKFGLNVFLGRVIGYFIGIIWLPIIVSVILSLLLFLIFRKVAEKYKKYFDLFTVIFFIISICFLLFIFRFI